VALPERRYALASELMAAAIDEAKLSGGDVVSILNAEAARHGEAIGIATRGRAAADDSAESRVDALVETLVDFGYEPRRSGQDIELVNCPFHALAEDHTQLVCGMNLAMLEAVVAQSDGALVARLSPAAGRCCVVLSS
jgi:predicted ArsR family transcriptional regulator